MELGTVLACDGDGCSVRLAETGNIITAAFSPLVRDRIRIRRRQLVAINTGTTPPEISWRWFIGQVESVGPEGVSVRRLDQPAGSCRVVTNAAPENVVSVGSEVYYGHAEDWEVVDSVAGDAPSNASQIAKRYFAYIEAKLSE